MPILSRKPVTGSTEATTDPATAAAAPPISPARNARETPRSASGPRSRRTRMSNAMPDTVRPNVEPRPSAGTTRSGRTNGTISRSATITSNQPPPMASAGARLRRWAYSTRDRFADSP